MINFYKLKQIQKYNENNGEDEQSKYTGMKINKHFLIVGKTGAGKTNCLMNYIRLSSIPKSGTFDHIFICYQTDEPLYEFLKEKLKDKISLIKGVSDFHEVDEFPDSITQKKTKKYLIVFDDCLNEKNKMNIKKIQDYFKVGRKKGCTVCFLTQRYYDTDRFIRSQCSYVLLASISKRDAVSIMKESGLDFNKDQFMNIFNISTKKQNDEDMPFMKINMTECDINQKFSRNFNEYIKVK